MATKITILGEEPQKKELKKIEFVYGISKEIGDVEIFEPHHNPNYYTEIKVVKRYEPDIFDLFICYDENNKIHTYLGHFNDGIV